MVYKRYTMLMVKKAQYYKDVSFQINLIRLTQFQPKSPKSYFGGI